MRPFAAWLANLNTNPVYWSHNSDSHLQIGCEHGLRMDQKDRLVEVHFYPKSERESPDPSTWTLDYTYLGNNRRPGWMDQGREIEFKAKLSKIVTPYVVSSGIQNVTVRGWAFGSTIQIVESGIGYAFEKSEQSVFGGTGYAYDRCHQTVRGSSAKAYAHDDVVQKIAIVTTGGIGSGEVKHFGSSRRLSAKQHAHVG